MREKVCDAPGDRITVATGLNTASYTVRTVSGRGLGATHNGQARQANQRRMSASATRSMLLGKRSERPRPVLHYQPEPMQP
jgi:hypothetical protein